MDTSAYNFQSPEQTTTHRYNYRNSRPSQTSSNSAGILSQGEDSLHFQHDKDIVQMMAEEKIETKQQVYSFRDFFITDLTNQFPDSPITFAINLCKGIGFILIGNLYDNVHQPKKLTFVILILLAIFTCLHGTANPDILALSNHLFKDHNTTMANFQDSQMILFQLASIRVFETGISIACLVILYNWFPGNIRGFMVSMWQASYLICPIIKAAMGFEADTQSYYTIDCIVMGIIYLTLAVVSKFVFYHHPKHINVIIEPHKVDEFDTGFFQDVMNTRLGNIGITQTQFGRYKHSVSFFDVLCISDVYLFIVSFVLVRMHEFSIFRVQQQQTDYFFYQVHQTINFNVGFLSLAIITVLQIAYIITSFMIDDWVAQDEAVQVIFSFIIGAILGQGHFLYNCLIPLKIAKQITEKKIKSFASTGAESSTVSYVGTVIGVIVGSSFLSNTILFTNLAFIIDRIEFSESSGAVFLSTLLFLSILVLYKKIKADLMTFQCIKKHFPQQIKSRKFNQDSEGE
eukprot:403355085